MFSSFFLFSIFLLVFHLILDLNSKKTFAPKKKMNYEDLRIMVLSHPEWTGGPLLLDQMIPQLWTQGHNEACCALATAFLQQERQNPALASSIFYAYYYLFISLYYLVQGHQSGKILVGYKADESTIRMWFRRFLKDATVHPDTFQVRLLKMLDHLNSNFSFYRPFERQSLVFLIRNEEDVKHPLPFSLPGVTLLSLIPLEQIRWMRPQVNLTIFNFQLQTFDLFYPSSWEGGDIPPEISSRTDSGEEGGEQEVQKIETREKIEHIETEKPPSESTLRVSFLDFWGDFVPGSNYFVSCLRSLFPSLEVISSAESADLVLYSIFGSEHKKYPEKKKIQYLGENERPTMDESTLSLSFDFLTHPHHVRLPFWALLFEDWCLGTSAHGYHGYTVKAVSKRYQTRDVEALSRRTQFCGMIYSKPNPQRKEFFDAVTSRGLSLASWGPLFHNMPETIPVHDFEKKLHHVRTCLFYFVCENSKFPGYHTEKMLTAYLGDAVPVYWGEDTVIQDFHPSAYIRCSQFSSWDALIDYMVYLQKHPSEYQKYLSQPLFASEENLGSFAPERFAHQLEPILTSWFHGKTTCTIHPS